MPYKDPEKRKALQRRLMRRLRARRKAVAVGTPARLSPRAGRSGAGGTPPASGLPGRLAAHLGGLTVMQGPRTGERFEVLPWQDRFLGMFDAPPGAETVNGRLADRLPQRPAAHVAAPSPAGHASARSLPPSAALDPRALTAFHGGFSLHV